MKKKSKNLVSPSQSTLKNRSKTARARKDYGVFYPNTIRVKYEQPQSHGVQQKLLFIMNILTSFSRDVLSFNLPYGLQYTKYLLV